MAQKVDIVDILDSKTSYPKTRIHHIHEIQAFSHLMAAGLAQEGYGAGPAFRLSVAETLRQALRSTG